MGLDLYHSRPIEVQAIQVKMPFKEIKVWVPSAHPLKDGRKIVGVAIPGTGKVGYIGDWIIKSREGFYDILSDRQFKKIYAQGPIPGTYP